MACYVGPSDRDLFLKDTIIPQKGSPIRLNHIISVRRLDKIIQVMSYTNLAIPDFNYTFLQQRQMQEGWNKNMVAHFDPSCFSVIYESIQECINRYNCPVWMFVPRNPRPFGRGRTDKTRN